MRVPGFLLCATLLFTLISAEDPLDLLLRDVDSELAALASDTDIAENAGLPVYLERASLEVGRFFRAVAAADNTSSAQETILEHYRAFYTLASPSFVSERASALPVEEANSTLALLRAAMKTLRAAVENPILRPPLPQGEAAVHVCDGFFCNGEGAPVFPLGFNVFGNHSKTGAWTPPFDMGRTNLGLQTVILPTKALLPNLTFPSDVVSHMKAGMETAASLNVTVHLLVGQDVPEWAEEKWPGIRSGNFTQHGVAYDIDNPGAGTILRSALRAFLDSVGCRGIGAFILGNEVTFMQSGTPYTMAKYRAWLEEHYKGSISSLNTAWNTTFAAFTDIISMPVKPIPTVEQRLTGGAAAEWWDWNVFNNARVVDWTESMVDALQSWNAGPKTPGCMATTFKLQDKNEFFPFMGKGINRTALLALLTYNGCDCGIAPNTAVNQAGSRDTLPSLHTAGLYQRERYFMDWLEMGAGYTLQRSLNPSKPLYDTEWHGAGTQNWRDEHMTAAYMEAAVWFALFHGQAMNVAWYFPREGVAPQPANHFSASFVGSFATNPQATDAFLRTYMVATSHGDLVAAIGSLRPVLYILRSWSSSALDLKATAALLQTFEVSSFLGVPLGFLEESQEALAAVRPGDIVLIPQTTHAADSTVNWLRDLIRTEKASVILVANSTVVAHCLGFTSSGVPRPADGVAFLDTIKRVALSEAPLLFAELKKVLLPCLTAAPAWCSDPNDPNGGPAFGVLCRFATVAGHLQGLVINMNARAVSVYVEPRKSLKEGYRMERQILRLEPGEVQLVDVGTEK